jgi:hypothetical protein
MKCLRLYVDTLSREVECSGSIIETLRLKIDAALKLKPNARFFSFLQLKAAIGLML